MRSTITRGVAGLCVAAVVGLAGPAVASAANIAVLGDNSTDDFLTAQGHTTTLVTDAQVATPGFLSSFNELVITRDGSSFGGGLSPAAAAQVGAFAKRVVALNGDFADSLSNLGDPTDAAVGQIFANSANWASMGSGGVIGEFNGAVSLLGANADGFTPLGLLTGSAGPLTGDPSAFGSIDVAPAGTGHPVLTGVSLPVDPNSVEFGAQITGADSAQVLAKYTSNDNPAILARDLLAGCAPSVAADTPAGCWRMGEPSGTTMFDSSPNANNGTYLGGVALGAPGALSADPNTAATYDGINDTSRVPDSNTLDVGNSFSLEGWIKRSSTAKSQEMMNKGANGFQLVVMNAGSGNKVFLRKANVTTIAQSSTGVLADGQYHHIVATMNGAGTTAKIYVDGSDVTQAVAGGGVQVVQNTAFPLTFGGANSVPANYDEFAVYDNVLTAGQVLAHRAAGL